MAHIYPQVHLPESITKTKLSIQVFYKKGFYDIVYIVYESKSTGRETTIEARILSLKYFFSVALFERFLQF